MMSEQTSIKVENGEQLAAIAELHTSGRKRPSDPITQWKGVIHAKVVAKKIKSNIREKPSEVYTLASHEASLSDRILSPPPGISYGERQEESIAQSNRDQEIDPESLKYLGIVHAALVQQLNSYGLVLTLLAAVTSVAILQPPGSFDQGHMLSSSLVACFLVFSSVSFLLACTGLMAVTVGSAALFRPWFFPEPPSESLLQNIADAQAGSGNGKDNIQYDDMDTLAEIITDNVLRVRRLRIYLALSLGFCMVAFVCGAFAILGPEKRNLYMAIGTILGGGGLVLAVETGFTLAGPTHPPRWLRKCGRFLRQVGSGRLDQAGIKKNTSYRVNQTMTRRTKLPAIDSVDPASFNGNVR